MVDKHFGAIFFSRCRRHHHRRRRSICISIFRRKTHIWSIVSANGPHCMRLCVCARILWASNNGMLDKFDHQFGFADNSWTRRTGELWIEAKCEPEPFSSSRLAASRPQCALMKFALDARGGGGQDAYIQYKIKWQSINDKHGFELIYRRSLSSSSEQAQRRRWSGFRIDHFDKILHIRIGKRSACTFVCECLCVCVSERVFRVCRTRHEKQMLRQNVKTVVEPSEWVGIGGREREQLTKPTTTTTTTNNNEKKNKKKHDTQSETQERIIWTAAKPYETFQFLDKWLINWFSAANEMKKEKQLNIILQAGIRRIAQPILFVCVFFETETY